jgi:GxxExxY protein
MTENEISKVIVDAAIEVHRTLGGPGLLESVYESALKHELQLRGLNVESQTEVPVLYKGQRLDAKLRLDLLVEGGVIVEVKAAQEYNPIFKAQLLTYLRLTGLRLGLVVNFGVKRVGRDGTHRVVNGLPDD